MGCVSRPGYSRFAPVAGQPPDVVQSGWAPIAVRRAATAPVQPSQPPRARLPLLQAKHGPRNPPLECSKHRGIISSPGREGKWMESMRVRFDGPSLVGMRVPPCARRSVPRGREKLDGPSGPCTWPMRRMAERPGVWYPSLRAQTKWKFSHPDAPGIFFQKQYRASGVWAADSRDRLRADVCVLWSWLYCTIRVRIL
jgi:hypothetical protein